MPIRFLIYAGMVYGKYIEQSDFYHRDSTSQRKAPAPKRICFYNGKQDRGDKAVLSLLQI